MANKRSRKRERKKTQKPKPNLPPPPPPSQRNGENDDRNPPPTLWQRFHRIPRWLYALFLFVVSLIGFSSGYPWLSLQKDESLNPENPYKTLFLVHNEGYIPATNIRVTCSYTFVTDHMNTANNHVAFSIDGPLWHANPKTLPCIQVLSMSGEPVIGGYTDMLIKSRERVIDAAMVVRFDYSVFWIDLPFLRGTQTFQLLALPAKDGTYRWTFH